MKWVKIFKNGPVKFVEDSLKKCFKGCLPQILLGPFLSILTQIVAYTAYKDSVDAFESISATNLRK